MDLLRKFQSKHSENKAIVIFKESEHIVTEADIQETPSAPIVAAPTIREADPQEQELDALIE